MKSVLAIFAHPDDIEFVAAGTLLLLKDRGWQVHYCNLSNGGLGSTTTNREETAAIRLHEAKESARLLDAVFYPPICGDLDVFYNRENLAKVAAIVRMAKPSLVLTHSPIDYMEDHMQTCRLAVTAAFSKCVPNMITDPQIPSHDGEVAVYHAQPHGNRTPLGEPVVPQFAINIDTVMDRKLRQLECHQSQQNWLQSTQKLNSYLQTMIDLGQEVAHLAKLQCEYAEGWRRHLHLGFSGADFHPLEDELLS